jgi:hypothetical protein
MRALRRSCSSPRPSCPTRVEPNSPCVTEPLRVAAILEILPSPSALRRAAESHRPIEGGLEDHSPDIFLSPPFRSAPRAEVAKESPLTPLGGACALSRRPVLPLSGLRHPTSVHAVERCPVEPEHARAPDPEVARSIPAAERRALIKDLRFAPAWMHPIFRELAGAGR